MAATARLAARARPIARPNPGVGALLVKDEQVIARGWTQGGGRPHAEAVALAGLSAGGAKGATLYVTLEPCAMCATAMSAARITRLYYGASDPKSGGVAQGARVFSHSQCHHVPEIYDGIAGAAAAELLKRFFAQKRGG